MRLFYTVRGLECIGIDDRGRAQIDQQWARPAHTGEQASDPEDNDEENEGDEPGIRLPAGRPGRLRSPLGEVPRCRRLPQLRLHALEGGGELGDPTLQHDGFRLDVAPDLFVGLHARDVGGTRDVSIAVRNPKLSRGLFLADRYAVDQRRLT